MEKRFGPQPFGTAEDDHLFEDEMERDFDKIFGHDPFTGKRMSKKERQEEILAHAPEFVRTVCELNPDLAYDYSPTLRAFVIDRYFMFQDPDGTLYWSKDQKSESAHSIASIRAGSDHESPDMRRFREKIENLLKPKPEESIQEAA